MMKFNIYDRVLRAIQLMDERPVVVERIRRLLKEFA